MAAGCRDDDKVELLRLLQDIIDKPFPKSSKSEQVERQNMIRNQFCESPIDLPRLVVNLIAGIGDTKQNVDIFQPALQLSVAMVGPGYKPVQDKMLQLFQEDISE